MSKQTESFYNRFSSYYPLIDLFLKPQKRKLFEEINGLSNGTLLEIGVGDGAHLQQYKTHTITAIDTSSAMLELASSRKYPNVELHQMSGEALTFDDARFDYVVLSHVLAVVDNPNRLLEEAHRVLKPNGRMLILNHFTPDNWLKYIDHSLSVVSRLLRFKSVFRISDLTAINRFSLVKEVGFGPGSYFKLLTYLKK